MIPLRNAGSESTESAYNQWEVDKIQTIFPDLRLNCLK